MITIIGCNKGGAGKTTIATNVAVGLALKGLDVCIVDADPQRSASRWFSEREENELQPKITLIEKRDNISQTLKSLNDKFDHVIVDVAGRNSREFITGAVVAHKIIAPHQCSQLDLDTLIELDQQIIAVKDLNPILEVFCYQTMATTNPILSGTERKEFMEFIADYPFRALLSVCRYRKIYRDVFSEGKSVLETTNEKAASEINDLIKEVYYGA